MAKRARELAVKEKRDRKREKKRETAARRAEGIIDDGSPEPGSDEAEAVEPDPTHLT